MLKIFLKQVELYLVLLLICMDLTNDQSITYKIVGNLESDPEAGLISIQTPIAQGLMGKNVGDEVSISTPSGPIDLEIEKVQHL